MTSWILANRSRTWGRWAPLLCLLASIGCGGQSYPGPQRAAVTGKVTFDGQPLGNGNITFMPTDSKGQVAGGGIVKGEFQLSEELGPMLGDQTIRFHWNKPTGKKVKDADSGQESDETEEGLPAKYHVQSKEKVTIKAGKNVLNFDLTSK